jgi:hypothetical protein
MQVMTRVQDMLAQLEELCAQHNIVRFTGCNGELLRIGLADGRELDVDVLHRSLDNQVCCICVGLKKLGTCDVT